MIRVAFVLLQKWTLLLWVTMRRGATACPRRPSRTRSASSRRRRDAV